MAFGENSRGGGGNRGRGGFRGGRGGGGDRGGRGKNISINADQTNAFDSLQAVVVV